MPRVKNRRARFSLGAERKSALLCQLHDGPAFFAPAFGGVEEPGLRASGTRVRVYRPAWPFGAGWDACAGGRQDRWLKR